MMIDRKPTACHFVFNGRITHDPRGVDGWQKVELKANSYDDAEQQIQSLPWHKCELENRPIQRRLTGRTISRMVSTNVGTIIRRRKGGKS